MRTSTALIAAFTLLLGIGLTQQRAKDEPPKTFEVVHTELGEAWRAGEYGRCLDLAREVTARIVAERTRAVLAALPAAPEGYEVQPPPESPTAQQNSMLAALSVGVGSVVEQRYRGPSPKEISVTVTADSPMVAMFGVWASNPTMLGANAELVQYEERQAVLKNEGTQWTLMILIDDAMVEATFRHEDDEFALRFFDQAAVDRLAAALAK